MKSFFVLPVSLTAVLSFAMPAYAQVNVSSQMLVTSGSCSGCDFSNKTMPRMTLKESNLSGSLFNRANLSGGYISNTNLSGAHFRKAFLARIEGTEVDFSDARMEDVTLTEAKIDKSLLMKSDLRRADLSRAHVTNSRLDGADLSNSVAVGAFLTGSNFTNAKMDHADLLGARLDDSIFRSVEFGNALLKGAGLDRADLSSANLSRVQGLTQAQLDVACGNEQTQLPMGLSVKRCADSLLSASGSHPSHGHKHMDAQDQFVAARIDRSMVRIETLMPTAAPETQNELRSIYQDLLSIRNQIEK